MLLWEMIKVAMSSLWGHKLRSFLATLGIVIGVAALITMFSIGYGAKAKVTDSIKRLGTDLIFIRPELPRIGLVRAGTVTTLVSEDADAIRAEVPGVRALTEDVGGPAQVRYFSKNRATNLLGGSADMTIVRNWKTSEGHFFNDVDARLQRKVCLLGETVKRELFGERSPIGEKIQINGATFEVIGVLEPKGTSFFMDVDDEVMVPSSTAMHKLFGIDYLQGITVKMSPESDMEEMKNLLNVLLRTRHRIRWDQDSDFIIHTQTEILGHLEEITKTMTSLLAGVAAVSLIVGGIGIMNVMLVSVRERTREVGIRKALGARRRDIRTQFLVESMVMSLLGGVLGMGLGIGVSAVVAFWLADWPFRTPEWSIIMALAYSAAVGLLFGVWPAIVAARLHPIEALRYE